MVLSSDSPSLGSTGKQWTSSFRVWSLSDPTGGEVKEGNVSRLAKTFGVQFLRHRPWGLLFISLSFNSLVYKMTQVGALKSLCHLMLFESIWLLGYIFFLYAGFSVLIKSSDFKCWYTCTPMSIGLQVHEYTAHVPVCANVCVYGG